MGWVGYGGLMMGCNGGYLWVRMERLGLKAECSAWRLIGSGRDDGRK